MKKLLFLLLVSSQVCYAQVNLFGFEDGRKWIANATDGAGAIVMNDRYKASSIMYLPNYFEIPEPIIEAVGVGEYSTVYKKTDKTAWQVNWEGNTPVARKVADNIEFVQGGQYHNTLVSTDGSCYTLQQGVVTKIATGVSKAYGLYTSDKAKPTTVMIMTDGTLSIVGDWMGVSFFTQPLGKRFTKIAYSGNTNKGSGVIFALTIDGLIYKYSNSTPVLIAGVYTDVTAIGDNAVIAATETDIFSLGEGRNPAIVGLAWDNKKITSIKSPLLKFPLKQVEGNYNTLHVIDADGKMYALGSNGMGEVGNGVGKVWEGTATNQWDWNSFQLLSGWVLIPGKWKQVNTSNIISFYLWAQDSDNVWYSWGRNKARSLGNLGTLSINEEAIYPNNGDVWKPTPANPFGTWAVSKYVPGQKIYVPPYIPAVPLTYPQSYVDSLNAIIKKQLFDISEQLKINTNQVGQIFQLTNSNAVKDAKISAAIKALQ